MRINDPDIINGIVRDDDNPEIVVASCRCFIDSNMNAILRKYISDGKERIFVFFSRECVEPDMNIFDYATTWNRHHALPGRIIHNTHFIYNLNPYTEDKSEDKPYRNTLTYDDAVKLLRNNKGFCNFMYSHASPDRDKFFHLLSAYKRIDSFGPYLNNMNIEPSREAKNWYDLSVEMKHGYKFSIAMENASCSGYTSEKIISSLQAHTVPIYWGDPDVAEFLNPKAFINCHDYSSFEEVIERVKEIDNNDDLWLEIVTQPWQTEAQRQRTIELVEEYNEFWRKVFLQDIDTLKRRTEGAYYNLYTMSFWEFTLSWQAEVRKLASRALRRFKRITRRISGKATM